MQVASWNGLDVRMLPQDFNGVWQGRLRRLGDKEMRRDVRRKDGCRRGTEHRPFVCGACLLAELPTGALLRWPIAAGPM